MKIALTLGAAVALIAGGTFGVCHLGGVCPLSAIAGSDRAPSQGEVSVLASGAPGVAGDLAKASAAATYRVDPVHSSVHFMIKHAGVTNFYGRFNDLSGSFSWDPENESSNSMTFTVKTESVDTNNNGRNEHLRSPDFFNARQFPEATFTSKSFTELGDNAWEVQGELSLHGETKPVTAQVNWLGTGSFRGTDIAAFEAVMTFKRSDFGMTTYLADDGGESGGVGNTVTILLSVEGGRQ